MTGKQGRYLSYLVRLWQERDRLPGVWRASLEDPHTGERRGFADVVQLFAFLEEQLSQESETITNRAPPGGTQERSEGAQAVQAAEDPAHGRYGEGAKLIPPATITKENTR